VQIGPINEIRPVAVVTPAEGPVDLGKVFAVELRHQGGSAEESPNQKASRGLEEEDGEEGAGREEQEAEAGGAPGGTVNLVA
jgi:hypothetical protein